MKAILVIEEPNECIDCPCYRQTKEDGGLFEDCKAMMMPLNWREVTEKPSWCPLKPLPNAINERGKWISEEYQKGWNAYRENLE